MKILGVEKNSIAEEIGIEAGDLLTGFNGIKVTDILDYEYYNSLEEFSVTIRRGSESFIFDIDKYEDESLGLILEREINVRNCRNNCIFCFVNQLPENENLRETLKVKDDDYRHSFISGNYVTLTNLSEFDIERIIRIKLSPLYVSVHTVDNALREKMLGTYNTKEILPLLKKFYDNGIILHTQIVYCPGINEDLENSITELFKVSKSLSVVPVGLTKNKNPQLKEVTKEDAVRVIDLCERYQKQFYKETGTRFVYPSDEFYIKAGRLINNSESYEDYVQIENGVGLLAKFSEDFSYALSEIKAGKIDDVSIATGESAFEFIKYHSKVLTDKFGGHIAVYKIKNDFFGSSVTVAGLITGRDLYNRLKDKPLGKKLILPSVMLKEFDNVFLDNMSVEELESKLKIKIEIVKSGGDDFVRALTEEK